MSDMRDRALAWLMTDRRRGWLALIVPLGVLGAWKTLTERDSDLLMLTTLFASNLFPRSRKTPSPPAE